MYYDDHGLVGTTWNIIMVCVANLCEVLAYKSTCELMWKYVFLLCILGDHVRLWLCVHVCGLRVDAWLFILDYMSL